MSIQTLKGKASLIIAVIAVVFVFSGLIGAVLWTAHMGDAKADFEAVGYDLIVKISDLDAFPVAEGARIGTVPMTETMTVKWAEFQMLRPGSANWEKVDNIAWFSDGNPWFDAQFRRQVNKPGNRPLSDSRLVQPFTHNDASGLKHVDQVFKEDGVLQVNGLTGDQTRYRLVLHGVKNDTTHEAVERPINLWARSLFTQLLLDES